MHVSEWGNMVVHVHGVEYGYETQKRAVGGGGSTEARNRSGEELLQITSYKTLRP